MGTLRRLGAGAATAAVVGLVLVAVPGGTAGATETQGTIGPSYIRSGNLFLWTGSGAAVTYDRNRDGVVTTVSPGTDAVQPLVGSKTTCLLTSAEPLLGFVGQLGPDTITNRASFASGSIGVAEKKTGTSCAQVASGTASTVEKLTLNISGPKLVGDLGALVAGSAYLDVELKASARILATAYLKGKKVYAYELQSGSTIGAIGTPVEVSAPTATDPSATKSITATVFTCNNPSDSGPDSGVGDNCRWPISSPSWLGVDDNIYFDRLELAPLNGYFSLEGGADGTVATTAGSNQRPTAAQIAFPVGQGNADVVELYDVGNGVLFCNQYSQTLEPAPGTLTPQVTFRRLGNASTTEECKQVPYSLANGASSATFLKPVTDQLSSQYVANMTWYQLPDYVDDPGRTTAIPDTTAAYTTGQTPIPLGWCPNPSIDTSGVLQGIDSPLAVDVNGKFIPGNARVYDQDPNMPGVQFSCVGTRYAKVITVAATATTLATSYVQISEQVYILGDILLRKGF